MAPKGPEYSVVVRQGGAKRVRSKEHRARARERDRAVQRAARELVSQGIAEFESKRAPFRQSRVWYAVQPLEEKEEEEEWWDIRG